MADHKKRSRKTPAQEPEKLAPDPARNAAGGLYKVDMTASAEAVYVDMYKKAKVAEKKGDYTSSARTNFSMIRQAVRQIIPHDPVNRAYALTGALSNMFRVKKGRYRIMWIASSKLKSICILYISETLRKEGDIHDPYRLFAQAVMSGQFNDIFAKYGVKIPSLKASAVKPQ
ncbi:MAG: type II toxin-antitoxin system YhaV family toxin [Acidobacteriia bacterium]|nr:type II toxin-antitoxin system YhaV family toxin [Terriglobia bacterium]